MAELAALAEALVAADSIVVSTGAGMSAESGVPTFRDAQEGLWAKYRPEDLATPEAFARNPARVWDWYEWRRSRLATLAPHAGHRALAGLQDCLPSVTLITQNVDGLHQLAGSPAVLELHGNIRRNRCTGNDHLSDWVPGAQDRPPTCEQCAAPLRPDVVWFGESLDRSLLERAFDAAGACSLFISVGTSTVVEPAASLGRVAASNGALLAEINPEATPLSQQSDFCFRRQAGDLLPTLLLQVERHLAA